MIDARHCNATDTSSHCSRVPKIEAGSNPSDLTLDLNDLTGYAPNFDDGDASVFGLAASREG